MTMPPPNACRRIRQLFLLLKSPNPNEASNARDKLERMLLKWNLKWEDIAACISIANEDDERRAREASAARAGNTATAPAPIHRLRPARDRRYRHATAAVDAPFRSHQHA